MNTEIDTPKFWLVWAEPVSELCNLPTIKHATYTIALAEAKRLASKHGGVFHVVCHVATVEKSDLHITELTDGIPF